MKTSMSEEEFSKVKKIYIKSKDIKSEKKAVNNKTKFKEKECNESCICETKYD